MAVIIPHPGEFRAAPAHGDNGSAGIDGRIDGFEQIGGTARCRDREDNGRIGRDGMCPFDVQRCFQRPTGVRSGVIAQDLDGR